MAKGSDEPPLPPLPSPLESFALSHHQLLFGFLGVISPSGRRAITGLSLPHTGNTAAACAHMGVCGRRVNMDQRAGLSMSQ